MECYEGRVKTSGWLLMKPSCKSAYKHIKRWPNETHISFTQLVLKGVYITNVIPEVIHAQPITLSLSRPQ